MPKNWLIYWGLIVVVGTAAVFAGAWLTKNIEFILPYSLATGILMIGVGFFLESRKPKDGSAEDEA